MPRRLILAGVMLCLVGIALPVRAADPKREAPTFVLRVQSIDNLMADVKYLAALVGEEEQAKQLEGLLNSMAGEKGLAGFDTKRPLGVYATFGSEGIDSTAVGLIPVADEQALLGLLTRLNFKAEKGQDGIYTVAKSDKVPVDVYFRFANGYAYVTARSKSAIAQDKLLPPTQVLPVERVGTLSLVLHIDQIPKPLREIGLSEFERRVKETPPEGKTEAERQLDTRIRDQFVAAIATLVDDGEEVALRLDVDRQRNTLSFDMSLSGKPGTRLATTIADLGQTKSLFAGIPTANSALVALGHLTLPEQVRKAVEPAFEETVQQGLANEKDPFKRAIGEKFFKALIPTVKAGELDAELDIRGPMANNHYTVVGGIKLRDGQAIERVFRETVQGLPEADRSKIQLDAEKSGEVSIHRLNVMGDADADAKNFLGEGPLYIAIRSDALLVAAGEQPLPALKQALAAAPKVGKPFLFEMALGRLAPLMAKDNKAAPRIAEQVFAKNPDSDKFRVSLDGGKALQLRMELRAELLRFFVLIDKENKSGAK
jgi:hypothetical protein